jgi:hypothetical protein
MFQSVSGQRRFDGCYDTLHDVRTERSFRRVHGWTAIVRTSPFKEEAQEVQACHAHQFHRITNRASQKRLL